LVSRRPMLYRRECSLLTKATFKVILMCLIFTTVVSYLQCLVMWVKWKVWLLLYFCVYEVYQENSDLETCKLVSRRPILYQTWMPFYVPRSHSGDINVFGIDSRYFIFTMLSHVSEMKGWHLLYIDVYEVKHENSDWVL
jgi:hypothetical protein